MKKYPQETEQNKYKIVTLRLCELLPPDFLHNNTVLAGSYKK